MEGEKLEDDTRDAVTNILNGFTLPESISTQVDIPVGKKN